jgi:hypothetical protein
MSLCSSGSGCMGGPRTRATRAMALIVAQVAQEQFFSFWPISPTPKEVQAR